MYHYLMNIEAAVLLTRCRN